MESRTLNILSLSAVLTLSAVARGQSLGAVPGVVISHQPAGPAIYISSPSITIMPNGDYFASHDLFGSASGENTTKVFRSTDRGQTWAPTATITNQFWSTIFNHNGELYIWGYRNGSDNGDIQIRKSTDNGLSWTTPTNGSNGLLVDGDFGGSPNAPAIHNGRIWIAQGGKRIMSAPVNSNLMLAGSWTLSDIANTNNTPLGSGLTITEAQVVASPQTGVVILPKIGNLPNTVLIRASANPANVVQPSAADYVSLPGGEKKFGATYDAVSQKFYVLDNTVLPAHAGITTPSLTRTASTMLSSKDLKHWDVEKVFLFTPNIDNGNWGEAFQYFNFAVDGDDLAVASRTAFDVGGTKPPRGHDSNLMTFHRIEDFRNAMPSHLLVADTNNNRVMRYELTQTNSLAPIGQFNLGSTFSGGVLNRPMGLVQAPDGDVFVGEEADGGRILRFDSFGNFKQIVATEGAQFAGRPEALALGTDGSLYMTTAFGTVSDRIYKINPVTGATTILVDTNFAGGSLNNPRGLAIGADGVLYVADRESNAIRKFDPQTGAFLGNIDIGPRPQAITYSAELEQFIAANRLGAANAVHRIDENGTSSQLYNATDIGAALGVAVIDGQIFWSDFDNGRIYKSTGVSQKFTSVASGLSGPGHLLSIEQPAVGERSWIATTSGNWDDPLNWYYWGRPDTDYEVANFGSAIGAAGTIAIDRSYTMKGVRFRSEHAFNLTGSGSITIDSDSSQGVIEAIQGQHVISVPVKLNDNLNLRVNAGASLQFTNALVATGKVISKSGAGVAQLPHVRATTLNVDEGTIRVSPNSRPNNELGTSIVQNLSIAENGALDLLNNALVIDYLTSTPLFDVRSMLRRGIETGTIGLLTSVSGGQYALGYAENSQLNLTTFAGVNVDQSSVLVQFTRFGDANLDLTVNISDFAVLAAAFNQPGIWTSGDFNYDGLVNIGDFALLAANFNRSVPAELPRTAIPEPTALALFSLALLSTGTRRSRNAKCMRQRK